MAPKTPTKPRNPRNPYAIPAKHRKAGVMRNPKDKRKQNKEIKELDEQTND